MSTPTNPLNFRLPSPLTAEMAHPSVVQAVNNNTNQGFDNLSAIIALKSQIEALKTTTTTAAASSSSGSSSPSTSNAFPGQGEVTNLTGITSYSTQTSDNGALLILDDASPIAVALNSSAVPPFYCFFTNLGAGTATLTPTNGLTINGGATFSLLTNYTALVVYYQGAWWATELPGGTVTSVGLTVPSWQAVSGSPVTGAGVLAITDNTQTANDVFAGPTTGAAAAPTFRTLVPADLPVATTSALGAVKPDGSSITIAAGVISSVGTALPSGSANEVIATPNGSSGISSLRALVSADLPVATTSALGAVKPDGVSITISAGVISSTGGSVGGTPTDVTSSRAIGTTYQNTNATDLQMYGFIITATGGMVGNYSISFGPTSGLGMTPFSQEVTATQSGGSGAFTLRIPASWYYELNATGGAGITLSGGKWFEQVL